MNEYKQNREDVTCNIKEETEIDISVKNKHWSEQVSKRVTEYNKCVRLQDSEGSWIVILGLPS